MTINWKKIRNIVIYISVAIMICILCSSNPFSKDTTNTDSDVFMYIANRMHNGELPYKDFFDHKGPMIYFINSIGLMLNFANIEGIWILQCIAIFITILFTHKIIKEKFELNDIETIILTLLINSNIVFFIEKGNLTEVYALPMITVALYCMLKEKTKGFLIGVLLALVVALRINMIALWIVYYIYLMIKSIKEKQINPLLKKIGWSLLGFCSVIGAVTIYLLANHILLDCIEQYIIFNLKYAVSSNYSLIVIIKYFMIKSNFLLYILILISDIIFIKKNKLKVFSFFYTLLTWITVLQPKNAYLHYGLILVPTFIIPTVNCYIGLKEKCKNNITLSKVVIGCLSGMVLLLPICYYLSMYNKRNIVGFDNQLKEQIAAKIVETTKKEDQILVIGNDCEFYLLTNRRASSKYAYQDPICITNPEIIDEVIIDINKNEPVYIVIHNIQTGLPTKIEEAIKGKYELETETSSYKLYKLEV